MTVTAVTIRMMIVILFAFGRTAFADPFTIQSYNSIYEIQSGKPSHYKIKNTSPWAEDIRIMGRTHNDNECNTINLVTVDLNQPPEHGVICTRVEDGTTKFDSNSATPKCLGKPGKFVVVYFEPFASFVGIDTFQFSISNPGQSVNTIADVKVDVTRPASGEKSGRGISNSPVQKVGRVEMCPPAEM